MFTLEAKHGRDDFIRIARERGFIHQITNEAGFAAKLSAGPVKAYVGFDCTAGSLHVGHLLPIMLMRLFARCGHNPVVLWGSGTSMIGDPSGRDTSRSMLTRDQIEKNWAGMTVSTDALLHAVENHHNDGWLAGLNHLSFLREVGAHFSVNRMLTMDSVKNRLDRDQPLTYLEFSYMLLQSYDFVALNAKHGVEAQFGGSDQWGNIVMGIDLLRKMQFREGFGVTVPLLTTASGAKMGKTANGAVWLNPDFKSPYAYWQFWRNTEDADVERFLGLFTELPMEEVRRLGSLGGAEINEAKKVLATEATTLLHGQEAAQQAAETAQRTFEAGEAAAGLPAFTVPLRDGVDIVSALIAAGFASTKSEARRLIEGNGVKVNGQTVTDPTEVLDRENAVEGVVKLSVGKRRHALLRSA